MFDIGWGELLLIGIVALIAIGPKELPGALRTLGQWMAKLRRMASEFQNQFHEAMREAEMADLKKQVDTLTTGFDPIEQARRDMESAMEDKPATPATASPDLTSYTEAPPAETVPGGAAAAGEPVAPTAPSATEKSLETGTPGGDAVAPPAGGRAA
jgi:sec-independent protein translocase protein TatB